MCPYSLQDPLSELVKVPPESLVSSSSSSGGLSAEGRAAAAAACLQKEEQQQQRQHPGSAARLLLQSVASSPLVLHLLPRYCALYHDTALPAGRWAVPAGPQGRHAGGPAGRHCGVGGERRRVGWWGWVGGGGAGGRIGYGHDHGRQPEGVGWPCLGLLLCFPVQHHCLVGRRLWMATASPWLVHAT